MIHVGADARLAMLDLLLGVEPLTIKLFVNDLVPEDGELERDYVELDGHGYADVGLDPAQWLTTPGDGGEEPALAVYPKVSWVFTAGPAVAVWGYFVVYTNSQRLAWSERFARPQVIEFSGDNISVIPTFRLRAMQAGMPPIQDGEGA